MPHVLLVDEDPLQAAVYARMLAARGFSTEVAMDANEAYECLGMRMPDAILTDLGLPRNECLRLIRTVRDLPQGRNIRIFVLANEFLEADALAAWDAGADQVVGSSTYPPEQVVEFVIAEVGGGAATRPAPPPSPDQAFREFLDRAAGYVARGRASLDDLRSGGAAPQALEEFSASMRRLQAAQAFRLAAVPQVAAVAEWLSRALTAWPSSMGHSSLRTMDQLLDVLSRRVSSPRASTRDVAACRALAVDDDPVSRTLVLQAFRKIRLACDTFESAHDALAAARHRRYDLVISDVMMPGMDGIEFVGRMREIDGYAEVPVVYVTAAEGFDAAFARDTRGGTDVIAKPYLIMELAAKAVLHLV